MRKDILFFLLLATVLHATARRLPKEKDFAGYLFAYFEGSGDRQTQEQLRFAISKDAKEWYALNGNKPVIASDSISESGGIRDPHILRGEDGCYYIVATDMKVAQYGWNENPGIVLLKSQDLINWSHAKINLSKDYPKNFGDAYWVWAPQTIYDKDAGKYMVYFTLQRDDRKSLITYYAYANKNFTGFEGEPEILFSAQYGSIDNDIIEKDGIYHLFYKGNTKDAGGKEIKNGIQQATSKSLHGPWKEDFRYLDAYAGTRTHVEGSGVFKLNGREEYVLMYDLYSSGRYEYQTSKDLIHFSEKPQSFRKDFFPRHGTVIPVTADELERLQRQWGQVLPHGNEAYLMVYFTDPTHSIHMATSRNGRTFTAVNGGKPVIAGDSIAQQQGVRDPHIYRAPDGCFYLTATDLHIFGQQEGLRDTEWERDGKKYGWGNNRGIVMMKSRDLIHWSHTVFRLDQAFPEKFGGLGCAWAPQTIYDPEAEKLMVYLTIRQTGTGKTRLYYAYANDSFTGFSTEPQLLFEYPDPDVQVLDADIMPMPDGGYCMTYCAQEGPAGIKMAVSDHINRGWQYFPQQIDAERGSCEAPTMYKLADEDRWILLYDIFSIKPHNFGFMETTDFKNFRHLGRFNEGEMRCTNFSSPKHGAVVSITAEEAERLEEYWK